MKNFIVRTVYGFIFAVVVVGSILISPYLFALLMLMVTVIGVFEMNKLLPIPDETGKTSAMVLISTVLVYLLIALTGLGIIDPKILFLLVLPLLFPFVHALFSIKHSFGELVARHYAPVFYVALPSALTLFFYNPVFVGEAAGPVLLLVVIVTVWVNDTFAYLTGSLIGKHRLYERISPKKSWEGSIGGLVFSLLIAGLFAHYSKFLAVDRALIIAILVVVFGSLGDLIESMLKRQAGVKDSGSLIPGHGGILDRFDATFFAIPFVFVYLIMTH
jgi:phosphatidate cytidylyltransferase